MSGPFPVDQAEVLPADHLVVGSLWLAMRSYALAGTVVGQCRHLTRQAELRPRSVLRTYWCGTRPDGLLCWRCVGEQLEALRALCVVCAGTKGVALARSEPWAMDDQLGAVARSTITLAFGVCLSCRG